MSDTLIQVQDCFMELQHVQIIYPMYLLNSHTPDRLIRLQKKYVHQNAPLNVEGQCEVDHFNSNLGVNVFLYLIMPASVTVEIMFLNFGKCT